ncbi:hypothetical protein AGABI2DRAFT_194986 [Agaricus bisporus var. bisporus H97]|uniref:hypothetical protein n=1 Tax=Agaricus bisporus var. bisporus (strain H97 / ATCC MYA-4626 / FGSC 10389) TaxID=936046 RepID=UPI00029F5D18|nr:hypothetical protein AGABI2DRAFT_194986 [Agaricus bisporus var. bisporus H97]EKV44196.1 hypothetical protein AGABI2DRAFT_194986 [Agaricus bisporus var. bisporus H97]
MAIEIHSGKSIYVPPPRSGSIRAESPPRTFKVPPPRKVVWHNNSSEPEQETTSERKRPKFRFSHDMESWMWVTLYILTRRVPRRDTGQRNGYRDQFFDHVYTNSHVPTNEREQVMRMEEEEFQSFLERHFTPAITGFAKHLTYFRRELRLSYLDRARLDDMFNPDTYGPIYEAALIAFREIISVPIPDINFDPINGARSPSPQPESQHKRQRTHEEQDDDDYAAGTDDDIPVEGRPVRKQPKRGRMQSTQAHIIIS